MFKSKFQDDNRDELINGYQLTYDESVIKNGNGQSIHKNAKRNKGGSHQKLPENLIRKFGDTINIWKFYFDDSTPQKAASEFIFKAISSLKNTASL